MTTASGIEREMACPASAVIPHVHVGNEYADSGNVTHGFIRAVIVGTPRAQALAAVEPSLRKACEAIDFRHLAGGILRPRAEAAYTLDIDTDAVWFLGCNIGRKYPALTESQVAGTNDIEGTRMDGVPVVLDVKSGYQAVTACRDNAQMKFHARVQMLRNDAQTVDARIYYTATGEMDQHTFTRFELDAFGDDLRDLRDAIAEARRAFAEAGTATVSSGDHCRYCPAMQACPRYTALARSMVTDLRAATPSGVNLKEWFATLTPADQTKAWLLADDAARLAESIREALKDIARQRPILLPHGKLLKETRSTNRRLRSAEAIALLRAKGATDEEVAALYDEKPTYPVKVVDAPGAPSMKKARNKRSAA